jgi:hypothetical protein
MVHTCGRRLLRGRWWPVGPKLAFDKMAAPVLEIMDYIHNKTCMHTCSLSLSLPPPVPISKVCSCTGITLLMMACFVCCTNIISHRVSQESIRESRHHMHCSVFWDQKQAAYPVDQGHMDPWCKASCTVSPVNNKHSNLFTNIRDILLKLNSLLWEIITDCMPCFFSYSRTVLHGITDS